MRIFILLILSLGAAATAQAEMIFAPGLTYTKDTTTSGGTKAVNVDRRSLDFRLGHHGKSGLYLGGVYSMVNLASDSAFAVGPTIGYIAKNGFFAMFSYYLLSEYKYGSGGKLTDGMGPQIDLGWVFPLTTSISIGPQLSYRSINYNKTKTGGTSSSADVTMTNMTPYITLWFAF